MAEAPKQKRAVALRYDPERDKAPKLVAKGKGVLADQILALARKNYVPIRQDPNLVQILSRLNVDREIPPQLYRAIASIIAFLYRVNRKA